MVAVKRVEAQILDSNVGRSCGWLTNVYISIDAGEYQVGQDYAVQCQGIEIYICYLALLYFTLVQYGRNFEAY